jgi:hypothetical protein
VKGIRLLIDIVAKNGNLLFNGRDQQHRSVLENESTHFSPAASFVTGGKDPSCDGAFRGTRSLRPRS